MKTKDLEQGLLVITKPHYYDRWGRRPPMSAVRENGEHGSPAFIVAVGKYHTVWNNCGASVVENPNQRVNTIVYLTPEFDRYDYRRHGHEGAYPVGEFPHLYSDSNWELQVATGAGQFMEYSVWKLKHEAWLLAQMELKAYEERLAILSQNMKAAIASENGVDPENVRLTAHGDGLDYKFYVDVADYHPERGSVLDKLLKEYLQVAEQLRCGR